MKSVLISIKPKWCKLIANRKKTVEVRKTYPKLETPFKAYIYCAKGEEIWMAGIKDERSPQQLNGKVIGEFVCDNILDINVSGISLKVCNAGWKTCMSLDDFRDYLGNTPANISGERPKGYAWHISNLVIYDKPKELSEFNHSSKNYHGLVKVTRPPHDWYYVESAVENG